MDLLSIVRDAGGEATSVPSIYLICLCQSLTGPVVYIRLWADRFYPDCSKVVTVVDMQGGGVVCGMFCFALRCFACCAHRMIDY